MIYELWFRLRCFDLNCSPRRVVVARFSAAPDAADGQTASGQQRQQPTGQHPRVRDKVVRAIGWLQFRRSFASQLRGQRLTPSGSAGRSVSLSASDQPTASSAVSQPPP